MYLMHYFSMAMTDLELYVYNHTCLGPHREKQTKPGKLQRTQATPKKQNNTTFERMFGFDSKAIFVGFPFFLF